MSILLKPLHDIREKAIAQRRLILDELQNDKAKLMLEENERLRYWLGHWSGQIQAINQLLSEI